MRKSKTYDPGRVPKARRLTPDGHDDGAGGPVVELAQDGRPGPRVPFWLIDDPQGDGVEPPTDDQVEGDPEAAAKVDDHG